MSVILLAKEFDSWTLSMKLLRNYLKACRRKHASYQHFASSTTFNISNQFRDKRQKSSVSNLTVAAASSSASIDYRSKLLDSLSPNERLHRGVSVLLRNKSKNWRFTAALFDVVVSYLDDADQLSRENADILLRCCGRLTPAATFQRRMEYLKIIWNSLPRLGLSHDLNAYVRLQQVLLQNQKPFSASAFLDRVRKAGFEPNVYLYLGSIIRCAMDEKPNLEEINSYVKALKNLFCDEALRSKTRAAVVSAHVKAGNEAQTQILLDEAKAGADTDEGRSYLNQVYFSIAAVNSQRGNTSLLFKTIDQARGDNVPFTDFQLLFFARWLAYAGRQDAVLRVLNYMPKRFDWIYRTLTFVLALLADGQNVTAMQVLQRSAASAAEISYQPTVAILEPSATTTTATSDELLELLPNVENVYHFLLDLFYLKLPFPQLMAICRRLADSGYTEEALELGAVAAFDMKRNDVAKSLLEEARSRSFSHPASQSQQNSSKPTYFATLSTEPVLTPRHFWGALQLRSGLFDLYSVLGILKQMDAEMVHPGVVTMAGNILSQFYCPQLDIETIFAVFGTFVSRQALLTAALCVFLREGDREKVRHSLTRFPRTVIADRSKAFINAICEYYKKTYDSQLVIEVFVRLDKQAKEFNQPPVTECLEKIHRRLSGIISSSDMATFVDALSKAGFSLRQSLESNVEEAKNQDS